MEMNIHRGSNFFLPARVKDALVAQDVQQKKDDEAKELEARAAQVSENQRLQVQRSASQQSGKGITKSDDKDGLKKEMLAWNKIVEADKAQQSRLHYTVFKSEQAVAFFKGLGRGDADDRVTSRGGLNSTPVR